MPSSRARLYRLLPIAALVLGCGLAEAKAPTKRTQTTERQGSKRSVLKAPRLHPRVQTSGKRLVAPPRLEGPNASADPTTNEVVFGNMGSMVAGEKVMLSPTQLVSENIALVLDQVTLVPVPFGLAGKVSEPFIGVTGALYIVFPVGQIAGTDVRIKCEGHFDSDFDITAGDTIATGTQGTYANFTIPKKKPGEKVRKTLNFIVETDDFAPNSVMVFSLKPETGADARVKRCLVEQLEG